MTEIDPMLEGREIAEKYLNYVYLGNIANVDNSTYCPKCKKLLVQRGSFVSKPHIENNICPECGYEINMVL